MTAGRTGRDRTRVRECKYTWAIIVTLCTSPTIQTHTHDDASAHPSTVCVCVFAIIIKITFAKKKNAAKIVDIT